MLNKKIQASVGLLGCCCLILGITLLGCSQKLDIHKQIQQSTTKQASTRLIPAGQKYEPQTVIVQGNKQSLQKWFSEQSIPVTFEDLEKSESLYVIHYESEFTPDEMSQRLTEGSHVEFAAPNYIVRSHQQTSGSHEPSVQYWLMQWAFENIGQDSPKGLQGRPGADINILKAWEKTRGSDEVIVGIIDTGIDISHPDLSGNIWINSAELEANGGQPCVDDDDNGFPDDVFGWNFISDTQTEKYCGVADGTPNARDDHGHGTHVSGIIGARGDNHYGVAGLNWRVKLVALKFLDANGSGQIEEAIRAVFYSIRIGVHILSNSWGGGGYHPAMDLAIRRAEEAGILFVAAAGNSTSNNDYTPNYPSNYEHASVLAVAASDNRDKLASFSSYGVNTVHIAAPGVDILSTIPTGSGPASQAYAAWSGTSMATPMVSGAAALLMAQQPELRGNPVRVKELLMESVDRIVELEGKVKSGGRMNVGRALALADGEDLNDDAYFDPDHYETITVDIGEDIRLGNRNKVDMLLSYQYDGAEYVRLFFDEIDIDAPVYDLFAIYNKDLKHVFSLETMLVQEFQTPWVKGDEIKVRFANAKVKVDIYKEVDFPDFWEGTMAGGLNCRPSENIPGWITCDIKTGEEIFFNHKSNGFKISKAEYLVEKEGK